MRGIVMKQNALRWFFFFGSLICLTTLLLCFTSCTPDPGPPDSDSTPFSEQTDDTNSPDSSGSAPSTNSDTSEKTDTGTQEDTDQPTDTQTAGTSDSGTNEETETSTSRPTDTNSNPPDTDIKSDTDTNTDTESEVSEPVSPQITTDVKYDRASAGRSDGIMLTELYLNGIKCALDKRTNTFYYSIRSETLGQTACLPLDITSSLAGVRIVFENHKVTGDSLFPLKTDEKLKFIAFNNSKYREYTLVFTTLPIMTITSQNGSDINSKTQEVLCDVTMQDPEYKKHLTEEWFEGLANVRLRGASSLSYPKKPYKVEMQKYKTDKNGNRVLDTTNVSFLGMRSDDDWTLDALYLDPTLLHNKVAYGLWQEIGAPFYPYGIASGPRCEYVEVFVNGQYNGLYLLTEPVDEKQVGVEKEENTSDGSHGVLIKTISWEYTKFDTYEGSPYNGQMWLPVWGGFEIKNPKEDEIEEIDWKHLTELLHATAKESDAVFSEVAGELLNKENIVNYWIFCSTLLARDNAGKNVYWSIRNLNDAKITMYIHPWDVDNCLGYRYGSPHAIKDPPTTPNYADTWFVLLRRYLENNVDGSADYLQTRWAELKNGACSFTSLKDRINNEAELLIESGVLKREKERWPESLATDFYDELDYTLEWLEERLEVMETLVAQYRQS